MGTRLSDSRQYAHLWGTGELVEIFGERARLASWVTILGALARAQARLGIIPGDAAQAISTQLDADKLDLDRITEQTMLTSHSTLGVIRELQRQLPESAREFVYYGATVQDLTDTWFALVMREVGSIVWRDLRAVEDALLGLAHRHRDTVMLGRTHGQPGAPITFGYKAAGWSDEVRRHVQRMGEARRRLLVGQLAGAVGTLGFFGVDGLRLRREFCAELDLGEPGISWLTTRDRIAEFGTLLAMICTTLARFGDEVYELARPEIGELREPLSPNAVGSITMPHKHNPEASEHLDTLARLVRANAAVLIEGMAGSHERDGRAWKAEWIALPEVCELTAVALQTALRLAGGLRVDSQSMSANLARMQAQVSSEQLLAGLSARVGKHRAQQLLQDLSMSDPGGDLAARMVDAGLASATEIDTWTGRPATGAAASMVDRLVTASRTARAEEPERWCP
ncbi:class-II fumarase/aspartase family protein [Leekyejoonella antrihumi]|uniref:Adenylosuccinate lyase family protein n=1 Tax=Leekyejoonella antrihumi TaxID=1660198 RepID=A0A563E642_9MICO|nr:adenylosuccinate lyase family protein [Leekyejoonella antrihumi]TWP38038.1 adenylosuccinate lyase family protein [Leekyejoonella antrihumi]